MEKITLYADLYEKLNELCEAMGVADDAKPPHKMAEHLREADRMSSILADEAQTMADHTCDALDTLYEKDFVGGIKALSAMVSQVDEMRDSLDRIRADVANALCSLRELTESAGWTPTRTGEEIQAFLDEGFELAETMSLGYHDGEFALLFENEPESGEFVLEPFVVARGNEDCYEEVRKFIEQFMDMEEEDCE